jgi:hypothetical protein
LRRVLVPFRKEFAFLWRFVNLWWRITRRRGKAIPSCSGEKLLYD